MGRIDDELAAEGTRRAPLTLAAHSSLAQWAKGQQREAIEAASAAYAEGIASGDLVGARLAGVNLARYALNIGHPARASRLLDDVDALVDRSADDPPHGVELAVYAVARGRIAEIRGDVARAEAVMTDAIAWLDAEGEDFARDAARLAWATTIAMLSPESARAVIADMEQLRATTAYPSFGRLAGIGLGLATGYLGDGPRGRALVEDALAESSSVPDTAQVLVRLGEMHLHLGERPEAQEVFDRALARLAEIGTAYWTARALCGLARSGADDPTVLLARARLLSDGDPAYDRLFQVEGVLRVALVGDVGVWRGDVPVAFAGRQAEFVVLSLTALAPGSVSLAELCDLLWPSPDPKRMPQRIRTLLWQVRRGLGPDAWRLGRDGDRLWLDHRGLEVVGDGRSDGLLDGWHHVGDVPRRWLIEQVAHPST